MNITIVQTFTDGFTTYQSGQELSVPSEVAQRWIADGKAQADTDGQQSWLSSTEVAATRALVSEAGRTEPLVRVGSYTGAGIIDAGIAVDAVILIPSGAVAASFKHRFTWRNNSPLLGAATAHPGNTITAINGTTFTLGVSAGASGYWIAIGDNGSGKVAVGSYAGNGVDDRAIAVGLEPVWVMVKRDNTYPCWVRASGMTTSYPLTAAASANNIKSLTSTGFTVGTAEDINAASDAAGSGGEAYDYLALAASPAWRVLQFVGNNAARTLATIPTCAAAILKSHDSGTPRAARIATSGMGGDKSVTATAEGTGVMAITGGNLSLSASAESNGSGITNTVLAFREYNGMVVSEDVPLSHPALLIGGADGGVICQTNNAAFNLLSPSPIAMELLWLSSGNVAANYYLIGRGESGAAGNIQFFAWLASSTGSLHLTFSLGGATGKSLEYGLTFLDGRKKHLLIGFDGADDVAVWVNGKRAKAAFSTTAVGAVSTPANAKFAIGCRRNTADAVANSCAGDAFALARLYNVMPTDAQAAARYRRAMFGDYSAADLTPLEEWDANNIVGTTWLASLSATNNGTIKGAGDVLVTI